MTFDVVTFGEAMVLLAPTESALLESAGSFHASVGGAELNCAIGHVLRLEILCPLAPLFGHLDPGSLINCEPGRLILPVSQR